MKFIAHRGASLERTEDTLAALLRGAEYGAFAVECDPWQTKDGVWVLFHDRDLKRMAGDDRKVCDITYDEMKQALAKAGKELTALDEVLTGYNGKSAILFDMCEPADDPEVYKKIKAAPFHAIIGVHAVDEVALARKFFAQEDVLAFMPGPTMAADFAAAGAGNIRLWEPWLEQYPIETVRRQIPADREIWIMSCEAGNSHPLFSMNGSPAQIDKLIAMGADAMLLNDIALMERYR